MKNNYQLYFWARKNFASGLPVGSYRLPVDGFPWLSARADNTRKL